MRKMLSVEYRGEREKPEFMTSPGGGGGFAIERVGDFAS